MPCFDVIDQHKVSQGAESDMNSGSQSLKSPLPAYLTELPAAWPVLNCAPGNSPWETAKNNSIPRDEPLGAAVHTTAACLPRRLLAAFCHPTGLTLFPGVNKGTMQSMLVRLRTHSMQGDLPRPIPTPCTQQLLEALGSSPAGAQLGEVCRRTSYLQPAVGSAPPVSWSALPLAPPRTKLTPGQRAWTLGTGLQDLDKIGPK